MSFLVSLAKRKKSPEQLVKLAVGCLLELPPPEERPHDEGEGEAVAGTGGGSPSGVIVPPPEDERGGAQQHDELLLSWSSLSSTATSSHTTEYQRTESNASDAAASSGSVAPSPAPAGGSNNLQGSHRRPSFLAQMSISSRGDTSESAYHHGPTTGPDADSRKDGKASTLGGKHSISVPSLFFSDPGKRSTSSAASPSLHHSNSTDKGDDSSTVMERLSKRLDQIKQILYGGENDKEVDQHKCEEMGDHVVKENLMPLLMEHFVTLPFETRKDAAAIFNNLCRHNYAGFAEPYLSEERFDIVDKLISGYDVPDITLICGTMLRECLKHDKVARRILFSERVWTFFDNYVHLPNFDVASDAFTTLKDLLTRHKALAAEFLEKNYDKVSDKYKVLLKSENYVTRRMSLKMLGELLVERTNFSIMMRYISSKDNLKAIMMLLRDKSGQIQFEAFQIFKVFVANPKKPQEIVKILVANREKLVTYLDHFHKEKSDDQFREEKALLIATLERLEYHEEPSHQGGSEPEDEHH